MRRIEREGRQYETHFGPFLDPALPTAPPAARATPRFDPFACAPPSNSSSSSAQVSISSSVSATGSGSGSSTTATSVALDCFSPANRFFLLTTFLGGAY